MGRPAIDIIGDRFGHLVVIKQVPPPANDHHAHYECICDCGQLKIISGMRLRNNITKTCNGENCPYHFNVKSASKTIHGQTKTDEYKIYQLVIRRCYNPKSSSYQNYGAKGIKVCDRWLEPNGQGFINFFEDMGLRPSKNHSIERINNNGNYEPTNCRWATKQEQNQNYSLNVLNPQLVKMIRWEYEVNKLSVGDIIRKFNLQHIYRRLIYCVVKYETWSNISIEEEKLKYSNVA